MRKGHTGESHSDIGVSYSGLAFNDADQEVDVLHDTHQPQILISKSVTLSNRQSRGKSKNE